MRMVGGERGSVSNARRGGGLNFNPHHEGASGAGGWKGKGVGSFASLIQKKKGRDAERKLELRDRKAWYFVGG